MSVDRYIGRKGVGAVLNAGPRKITANGVIAFGGATYSHEALRGKERTRVYVERPSPAAVGLDPSGLLVFDAAPPTGKLICVAKRNEE